MHGFNKASKGNTIVNETSMGSANNKVGAKFGGRSTAIGVGYEARIGAYVAVKMLVGDSSTVCEGVSGADVAAITMQGVNPVDDVVIELHGEPVRKVFVSAKYRSSSIALTSENDVFTDIVDSFVRQFSALANHTQSGIRLVWAVPASAGTKVTRHLKNVLLTFRADDHTSLSDFLDRRQGKEREVMCALCNQIRTAWNQHVNRAPSDSELNEFLRALQVEVFDFDDGGRSIESAMQAIRGSLAENPADSEKIWQWLELHFRRNNESGLRRTAMTLRRRLASEQDVRLKTAETFSNDIASLQKLTEENLERLEDHRLLPFPNEKVYLDRSQELTLLVGASTRGHLLITGQPGCGKSGLVQSLATKLRLDGVPVVLLLAEEMFVSRCHGAGNLLGLERPLDDVLCNWPDGVKGVLIIDALDAVRDVDTQKALRRVLRDVQRGESGWTVVASVREFDLKHGHELREMFRGDGIQGYESSEFTDVAHFYVGGLADAHLDDLVNRIPEIASFVAEAKASERADGIHRSPFFLRLAAELLRAGVSSDRLADWNSPVVLLRRFWQHRIQSEVPNGAVDRVLALICRQMVERRTMAISRQQLDLSALEVDAIELLQRQGILQPPILSYGSIIGRGEIRFSHHLLYDFAIAQSYLPATVDSFIEFTTNDPLLSVLFRQSFRFALEEFWDRHDNRIAFWEIALKLESATSLYGVSRNLAPLLVGRRVCTPEDLEPLLHALEESPSQDSSAAKALRHMAFGLADATDDSVRTGAGAWCGFALKLSSLLPRHAFLETSLVHIMVRLNVISTSLATEPLRDLNTAARRLLAHHISKNVANAWRYAGTTATEVLCRTYCLAPAETEAAFRAMLDPARLTAFPHWDLFDLAQHIEHLGDAGEPVVRWLFEAIFQTEPDSEHRESFGGQILSFNVSSRDNWSSIRYSLAEHYLSRSDTNPGLMTELACIAWNSAARRRRHGDSCEEMLATFNFRGVECSLVEDYGHVWGREFEFEENRILTRFEMLLDIWASRTNTQQINAALDRFAECNRTSGMWMVFLTTGAKHPQTLGNELEPVLQEACFLTHPDYSPGGVQLFTALHKVGGTEQRIRLEQLILKLPQAAIESSAEPQEPMPEWVRRAQNRILLSLEETDIVLTEVRQLRTDRQKERQTVESQSTERSPTMQPTDVKEELQDSDRDSHSDDVRMNLCRLLDAVKSFQEIEAGRLTDDELSRFWVLIGKCNRALSKHQQAQPEIARELWGYLTAACQKVTSQARWPAKDTRWKAVRRVLLMAATDDSPQRDEHEVETDDSILSWDSPAPRVDAAQGLPLLAVHFGRADKHVATALRQLTRDKSKVVRSFLANQVAVLWQVAPKLMWELIDSFIENDKRFCVLCALLRSLDRLWDVSATDVMSRLDRIARRARTAADSHPVHVQVACMYLFRYLRIGDSRCETYVRQLVADCDSVRASRALSSLPSTCRIGRWLTVGDAVNIIAKEEEIRQRTWNFFEDLLLTSQGKLRQHEMDWLQLNAEADIDKDVLRIKLETIRRVATLVDDIAKQLYFASGAFAERQTTGENYLTHPQKKRFWYDAEGILRALSHEARPRTAHSVVQTLVHLLPYSHKRVFLIAATAISSGSSAGYQHEPLAVAEFVKLIQLTLADYREIFQRDDDGESPCLIELLKVLDLFVEAGWAEARQLTNRLEEIYK